MRVFFDPQMSVPSGGYSPSGTKPAAVVADWIAAGMPVEIAGFEPVTPQTLELAHDAGYIDRVISLVEANGHGNRIPEVTEACRWTCGSMVAAARAALTDGIACSPSSGFHHARYAGNGGFCTFNGLIVAARTMLNEGRVRSVAIVDWDNHYGDGTQDIIDELQLSSTIHHWTYGAHDDISSEDAQVAVGEFLSDVAANGCGLVLYQAGADPHVDDPLGGCMTSEELQARDRMVFERCHALRLPVAWNLAGGYQREPDGSIPGVLAIHRATMREAIRVYAGSPGGGGTADPERQTRGSADSSSDRLVVSLDSADPPSSAAETRRPVRRTRFVDVTEQSLGKMFGVIGVFGIPEHDEATGRSPESGHTIRSAGEQPAESGPEQSPQDPMRPV
jgi:acetoin utilization deacetylase AcuC-like enzyme